MKTLILLILMVFGGGVLTSKKAENSVCAVELHKMRKKFPNLNIYEIYDKVIEKKIKKCCKLAKTAIRKVNMEIKKLKNKKKK